MFALRARDIATRCKVSNGGLFNLAATCPHARSPQRMLRVLNELGPQLPITDVGKVFFFFFNPSHTH